MKPTLSIALIAEFNPDSETHVATLLALQHSANALGLKVKSEWIASHNLSNEICDGFDAFWFNTGKPCRDLSKVLGLIECTRRLGIPTLGTCGGFQHLMLELGRNVLNLKDAGHEEYDPEGAALLITRLGCSLAGREMHIRLEPDSTVRALYGQDLVIERYYCNFGVNPRYVEVIRQSSIRISGADSEGTVRVIELVDHPFFVGTLYVPQVGSRPESPHPLVNGFLEAAAKGQRANARV